MLLYPVMQNKSQIRRFLAVFSDFSKKAGYNLSYIKKWLAECF